MSLPEQHAEPCFARQRLVWLRRDAWDAFLASREDWRAEPLIRDWVTLGHPLIVRRALPFEHSGLPLGLPLPPSAGKRRLSVRVEVTDVAAAANLPTLATCRGGAPSAWQATIDALCATASAHGTEVRVFGSLAWQWLTQLDYVNAASDLDLAWACSAPDKVFSLLQDIDAIAARAPVHIDGEFLRPNGAGVQWRELLAGGEVAMKTLHDVQLIAARRFIGHPP